MLADLTVKDFLDKVAGKYCCFRRSAGFCFGHDGDETHHRKERI